MGLIRNTISILVANGSKLVKGFGLTLPGRRFKMTTGQLTVAAENTVFEATWIAGEKTAFVIDTYRGLCHHHPSFLRVACNQGKIRTVNELSACGVPGEVK
jgi:hypothetical protein